ncbi:DUF4442 domain-containing protein [Arhodomonas sp. AD133]|uniref:DUF4442 domain-containing protein n=1 Tax=Arhodomonas sp. AD133 TaxID=3415009 RepID=UPI003EBE8B1A
MNIWPPFLGAGVRVKEISPDWQRAVVALHHRRWTSNYVGTQFGGSLFAMTDPFYMLMLLHALGKRYWVWDHSARIEYRRPGRGTVTARFELDPERLARIRAAAESGEKLLEDFTVAIRDNEGEVVAAVERTIYIRLKPHHRRPGAADE